MESSETLSIQKSYQNDVFLSFKFEETYKDDRRLYNEKFGIIVFSKNHVSSFWLVKIMECQKATTQTAYPVFYDVEPSEFPALGEAFAKHNKEVVDVMKEATNLAGWDLWNTTDGHEVTFHSFER